MKRTGWILMVAGLLWGLAWGWALAQEPVRIIWLHHSCGENLINEGGVREGLTALGYEFYDHGYNDDGLRLADGSYAGYNFDVPGDNTDPDGLAEIFRQPLHDPPDNTFSYLMQYDVIAFKSCFPTSNIASDEQLAEYQHYYLEMRARMAQYPDKLFVIVTQPPQVPGSSDPDEARRARALADWLSSDRFLGGQANIVTFDFFGYLAGEDNFLRPEYRYDDYDAHPNEWANREIGPRFVEFLDRAIRDFAPGNTAPPATAPQPTAPPTEAPPPSPLPPTEEAGAPPSPSTEPEGGWAAWEADADDQGSTAECGPEGTALRFDYQVTVGGWAYCGRSFDAPQDWSAAPGLTLRLRGEPSDQRLVLTLFSGDPEAAVPYELPLQVPADWAQQTVAWGDFGLAPWAAEGDPAHPDATRIVGLGLSVDAEDGAGQGVVWLADLGPGGAAPPAASPAPTSPPVPTAPPPPAEAAEGPAEERSGSGLCPLAMILPLGMAGMVLRHEQGTQRKEGKK